jgi:hypothetical protein
MPPIARYEPRHEQQELSYEREYYPQSQRIDIAYTSKLIVLFFEFVAACIVLYFFFLICKDVYENYGNSLAGIVYRAVLGLVVFIPIGLIICALDKFSARQIIDDDNNLESGYAPLDLQDAGQKTMYRIPRGIKKFSDEWEKYAIDIYDAMQLDAVKPYSKSAYCLNILGNKGVAYENVMRPILEKHGRDL